MQGILTHKNEGLIYTINNQLKNRPKQLKTGNPNFSYLENRANRTSTRDLGAQQLEWPTCRTGGTAEQWKNEISSNSKRWNTKNSFRK